MPQPNPANTGNDRNEALAALALLLAGTSMRYNLPALVKQSGKRPKPFRQIRPTNALASNMGAPHFAIVNAWAAALPDILAAVPFGRAAVAATINLAASRIGVTVTQAKAMIPRAVDAVEQFHRRTWITRVKASTGLDVSMFTTSANVADPVAATAQWSQALADDIHAQTKSRLVAALLVGAGLAAADAKRRGNEVIAKARTRAAGIGTDQTFKLSRAMDVDRRQAAGIDSYVWHHSPHVIKPRPAHVARNGRTFKDGEIDGDDEAGAPYGCQCWTSPAL